MLKSFKKVTCAFLCALLLLSAYLPSAYAFDSGNSTEQLPLSVALENPEIVSFLKETGEINQIYQEQTETRNSIYSEIASYANESLDIGTVTEERVAQLVEKYDLQLPGESASGIIDDMTLYIERNTKGNIIDGINQIWRQMKLRCVGLKRAQRAFEAAQNSVGCTTGIEAARMELQILLEDYDAKLQQYERIMKVVESLCRQIPEVEELLKIKGIGLITVAGIFAEVGDLRRFSSPRQLQKLAGLAITENSSGKHKGQTEISRRGRAHLRAILFRAVMPLVARNEEFQKLHHYLTTRAENPLKKMQSIIAICCKLLRVFYAVATKGCAYSAEKMLADIRRNQPLKAA